VQRPQIGVMIEVPAALFQIDGLARRADFLSIGSNDLAQYLLAVDRNNPHVADLYDALHPAVLRAIRQVIDGAHAHTRPVGICGEMAGQPAAAVLLLGMGIDSLSMHAANLPRVKWVIRTFSLEQAQALVAEALTFDSATEVRRYLNGALERAGLGGLVRAGK
jgi:phosphotransferase system enzyme I (PtsP)